jgi:hypothetical protein
MNWSWLGKIIDWETILQLLHHASGQVAGIVVYKVMFSVFEYLIEPGGFKTYITYVDDFTFAVLLTLLALRFIMLAGKPVYDLLKRTFGNGQTVFMVA